MKVFIKRFMMFASFSLALFVLLNAAFMRTNKYKALGYNTGRFLSVPSGIECATLGSSHGFCSFYWEDYPLIRSFDFAMPAQCYLMDYAMLRQYCQKFKAGAVVLLPISHFQICTYYDRAQAISEPYYYKILKPFNIPKYNISSALRYTPPIGGYDVENILEALFNDCSIEESGVHYRFIKREEKGDTLDATPIDQSRAYCREVFAQWTRDRENEDGYEKNIKAVSNILDLCYEKGFVPVLITAPISDEFNALYDKECPEFLEIFHRFTRTLTDKYKGLVYLDYSRREEFHDRHLFYDDQHLGASGGKLLTAMVYQDLKDRGIVFPVD